MSARRYQALAVEQRPAGHRVVRVKHRATGDELTLYERHGRVVHYATDTPCRDQNLRKLVRKQLREWVTA